MSEIWMTPGFSSITLISASFQCIPGCNRWDYQTSVQQSQTLSPFEHYTFNLEASFNDLQVSERVHFKQKNSNIFQYEYVKEVYTTSVPGFMSQIGGELRVESLRNNWIAWNWTPNKNYRSIWFFPRSIYYNPDPNGALWLPQCIHVCQEAYSKKISILQDPPIWWL